jgi:hypothetical protein
MLNHKWHATIEALNNYHIEESLRRTKDILASCMSQNYTHPRTAFLLANIAILHWHLGELNNAARYMLAAVAQQQDVAMFRYLYGCLSWEMGEWREAWGAAEGCLKRSADGLERVDCRPLGLDFVLERQWVEWNLEKAEGKARFDDGEAVGIWRMPGLKIFKPVDED